MSGRGHPARSRPALAAALLASLLAGLLAGLPARAGEPAAGAASAEARDPAAGVVLRARLAPATLWIDERVELVLEVEAPEGVLLEPALIEPPPGGLAVVEQRPAEAGPAGPGRIARRERVLLEPTGTGLRAGPRVTLLHRPAGAASGGRLSLELPAVEVRSVLAIAEGPVLPRRVAPPVPLPPAPRAWPWLAGGGAALLAGLGLLLLARRGGRSGSAAPASAEPAPETRALAALDRLEAEAPAAGERIAELQAGLAEVLRDYARGRLGLDAPRLTTEELAERIGRLGAPLAEPGRALVALLARCDLVKFARHRPTAPALRADLATARAVIRATAAAGPGRSPPPPP